MGGGTKEFTLRSSDEMHEDEPETITLKNRFLTIATARWQLQRMKVLLLVFIEKDWMK
ncbi:MAG: hypothetical protein WDN26_16840 [Chitinophagaceae bacterium]